MRIAKMVFDTNCELGESPVWDDLSGRLLWVDLVRGDVYAGDPASGQHEIVYTADRPVGAIRPAAIPGAGDGWVLVEQGRLTIVDLNFLVVARRDVGPQLPDIRSNEAESDPAGRLLFSTMAFGGDYGRGALFATSPQGQTSILHSGLTIPNGMCWSGDGRQMYFVDSSKRTLARFDYDVESGVMSGERVHSEFAHFNGVPDGIAIDEFGDVYVAIFDGGGVATVGAKGNLVGWTTVPTAQVTACAFGGLSGSTLYITTASYGMSESERFANPAAGAVYAIDRDATGGSRHRYRADWAEKHSPR